MNTERLAGWFSALRIGSHTFPATLLLLAISMGVTWWLLPFFSYLLGTGPIAVGVVFFLIFGVILLFKTLIFKGIYKNPHLDGEAALLEYLVQQNHSGAPGEEEVEMELLENALHLKQVRAHEFMAPRNEIVHIDVNTPVSELREMFIQSRLSRIIVTAAGDLDRILGYVHVQQLFRQPRDIHNMVMPITFVPVSIQANDLLNKFVKNRTNIACVVNEYGSIAGLVTLEDALEQLFGKIDDEHDQEEFIDTQVSEQEFIFSGRLEIQYLNERYPQLNLPTGDYNTLSGYLVSATQTIPEQGLRIALDGKIFQLELVSDRKIETIRVML
ncbi:MAG: CBS domain-containing protein [Saprospiraceae bacterium]|nr:CBS domain-containing protein [Saprospiraceae bacterium]